MTPRELADTVERWIVDNSGADEARCTIIIKNGNVELEHFERKEVDLELPPPIPLPGGTV